MKKVIMNKVSSISFKNLLEQQNVLEGSENKELASDLAL